MLVGSALVPDKIASYGLLTVQAFGVTVEVTAEVHHLPAIHEILPPGARVAEARPENGRFALIPSGGQGLLDVRLDEEPVAAAPVDVDLALGILDARLRMHIALNAPNHVFVHAGVVGVGDRALVLPGKSFAGKTTLVAALVQAGTGYWSDEYAALDADGLVHPYPKPLSIRNRASLTDERTVESLGGVAGAGPLPVGMVALAQYRRGTTWSPRACSSGEGAIKLLEHTVPARTRPEQSLEAVRAAATGALVLEGERGEADETAAALLSALKTRLRA